MRIQLLSDEVTALSEKNTTLSDENTTLSDELTALRMASLSTTAVPMKPVTEVR